LTRDEIYRCKSGKKENVLTPQEEGGTKVEEQIGVLAGGMCSETLKGVCECLLQCPVEMCVRPTKEERVRQTER